MMTKAYYASHFLPFTQYHVHVIKTIQEQFSDVVLCVLESDLEPSINAKRYFEYLAQYYQISFEYQFFEEDALIQLKDQCFMDALLNLELPNFLQINTNQEVPKISKHFLTFDNVEEPIAKMTLDLCSFSWQKEQRLVFSALSYPRFLHTMRVAYMIEQLAEIHQLHLDWCLLAAFFHDYAKELDKDELSYYMENYFAGYSDAPDSAWHGFVGSYLFAQIYDEQAEDIIEAIEFHTVGLPQLGSIGMALFIADYCEFKRPFENERQIVWTAAKKSLTDGCYQKLKLLHKYLKTQGKMFYWTTQNMYNWLHELQ